MKFSLLSICLRYPIPPFASSNQDAIGNEQSGPGFYPSCQRITPHLVGMTVARQHSFAALSDRPDGASNLMVGFENAIATWVPRMRHLYLL